MTKELMTSDAFSPDNLVAGCCPDIVTSTDTLLSGNNLKRGTLLGKVSTGGLTESLSTAIDGSQNPYAILAEDVDASAGDVPNTLIYIRGSFDSAKMTFGAAHTANSTKDALRALGIYLKAPLSA